jgi:hypothetical protein
VDSNHRPPGPEPGALARLSHAPNLWTAPSRNALGISGRPHQYIIPVLLECSFANRKLLPFGPRRQLKLFDSSLRTTTRRLIQAIDWAIEHRMDVVNLSLGTPNLDYHAELQSLVNKARAAGVTLVSARHAGGRPVLPGAAQRWSRTGNHSQRCNLPS